MKDVNRADHNNHVSPYPGPRSFNEDEEQFFFGRDREKEEIISHLFAYRLIFLYAQSGAGKTSLVNASLLPALRKERFDVLPLARVGAPIPQNIRIDEVENVYVFNTLWAWSAGKADARSLLKQPLSEHLSERRLAIDNRGWIVPRVLIFDQFEELFTSYAEQWKHRKAFFQQLADVMRKNLKPGLEIRIMFILREDYLANLDPLADLLPERPAMRIRLERLRARSALSAVKQPLDQASTERRFAKGVAESLVNRLLRVSIESTDKKNKRLKGEFIEPVQLQVVCKSLWDNLPPDVNLITRAHLNEFGDVDNALIKFYEDSIRRVLDDNEKSIEQAEIGENERVTERQLRNWFQTVLITSSNNRDMVYRGEKNTGGIPSRVVEHLERLFLIRSEPRGRLRWFELSHDRLIEPILKSNEEWRKGRPQVEQLLEEFEKKAHNWSLNKSDNSLLFDEVELKLLNNTAIADLEFSPNLYALRERSNAEAERRKIEEERAIEEERLEQFKKVAEAERQKAEAERQRAEEKHQRLEENKKANKRLRRASIGLVVLLLIALASLVYAQVQNGSMRKARDVAIQAQQQAEMEKARADAETQRANEQTSTAEVALRHESEARLQAEQEKARANAEMERANEQTRRAEVVFRLESEARLQAEQEKARANAEMERANEQTRRAEVVFRLESEARLQAEQEKARANAEMERANEQTRRAEVVLSQAIEARHQAEQEKKRADESNAKLTATVSELKKQKEESEILREIAEKKSQTVLDLQNADKAETLAGLVDDKPDPRGLNRRPNQIRVLIASESLLISPNLTADQILRTILPRSSRPMSATGYELTGNRSKVYSPDERYYAEVFEPGGNEPYTVVIRDASSKREIRKVVHDEYTDGYKLNDMEFSPDGKYLATASELGTVCIWEVATGREIARLEHSRNDTIGVTGVSFSPDGKYLATRDSRGSAHIWDVFRGKELTRIRDARGRVSFSRDGKCLLLIHGDYNADGWVWKPEDMVAEACAQLAGKGTNLTVDEYRKYRILIPARKTCPNLP